MKDLEMIRGRISDEWAKTVNANQVLRDSWRYEPCSGRDGKDILTFRFASLANVAAMVTQRVFTPAAIQRLAYYRHSSILNLAGDVPSRLTSTGLLLAGYLELPESQTQDFSVEAAFEGLFGKYVQDGNDTWVIPDAAVTLVEAQTLELQLPHQA